MLDRDVDNLGHEPYTSAVRSYAAQPMTRCVIMGLDSEWYKDHRGRNKLLCWQLSLDADHSGIYTEPLTWETLYQRSVEIIRSSGLKLRDITTIVYAVFWSTAESQWLLADSTADVGIEQYGSHQLHIRYRPCKRRSMVLFDVSIWAGGSDGLAAMARSVGLNKLDYDVSMLSPGSLDDPAFVNYALNDAYITGEMLRRLRGRILQQCHVDILRTRTPASTASADMRRRYVHRQVVGYRTVRRYSKRLGRQTVRKVPVYAEIWQTWRKARKAAMLASHGGRRECFYRGELPRVYEYDAKSAYPHSARILGVLPLREHLIITSNLSEWLSGRGGWGHVFFKFPQRTLYPCLPVDTDEGIVYPLCGESYCTTWEVSLALQMGADIVLVDGYYYRDGVSWLPEYEAEMIHRRAETDDPVLKMIYKTMANSLIGKLIQHRRSYDVGDILRLSRRMHIPPSVAANMIGLSSFGVRSKVRVGTIFMPEWYCLILGWYRANVSEVIMRTNAVQVCTDAVLTETYMGERFEHNGIVYELVDSGPYVAYRAGLYRLGSNVRHQGCSYDAAAAVTDHYIPDVSYITYPRHRIVTLRDSIRRGMPIGHEVVEECYLWLHYDCKRVLPHDIGWTRPVISGRHYVRLRAQLVDRDSLPQAE